MITKGFTPGNGAKIFAIMKPFALVCVLLALAAAAGLECGTGRAGAAGDHEARSPGPGTAGFPQASMARITSDRGRSPNQVVMARREAGQERPAANGGR